MGLIRGRAVCVHDLAQARAAVDAAVAARRPVVLLSAPAAACFAGCGWWRALVAAAVEGREGVCGDLLDCGDGAGRAMEALRIGLRGLVVDAGTPALAAVQAAAEALEATVLTKRPVHIDLADYGAARLLEGWVQARPGALPLDPAGAEGPRPPLLGDRTAVRSPGNGGLGPSAPAGSRSRALALPKSLSRLHHRPWTSPRA